MQTNTKVKVEGLDNSDMQKLIEMLDRANIEQLIKISNETMWRTMKQ